MMLYGAGQTQVGAAAAAIGVLDDVPNGVLENGVPNGILENGVLPAAAINGVHPAANGVLAVPPANVVPLAVLPVPVGGGAAVYNHPAEQDL
ncbi:hypothetical protein A2U01_0073542, partial [Trifolium medium]|nr:hypothetical protein [Trifolium medium]